MFSLFSQQNGFEKSVLSLLTQWHLIRCYQKQTKGKLWITQKVLRAIFCLFLKRKQKEKKTTLCKHFKLSHLTLVSSNKPQKREFVKSCFLCKTESCLFGYYQRLQKHPWWLISDPMDFKLRWLCQIATFQWTGWQKLVLLIELQTTIKEAIKFIL